MKIDIPRTNNFRNNKISIFSLAKSTGETWFEHSKASYHVGRVLWTLVNDEISKYLTKDEFLWCCFFHDAGKLMWKGFDDDHTPYTKEVLRLLQTKHSYPNILKNFHLEDLSNKERLIDMIKDHHDNKIKGSEWITVADSIASSDFGEISTFESSSLNPYMKFLISNIPKLNGYNLIKITFPHTSYLDRSIFGQLFLTKMLREATREICNEKDTFYLFDIEGGCKILSRNEPQTILEKIRASFKKYILDIFEKFDVIQLMGGQPQSFVRLRQYVFPEKMGVIESNLLKLLLIDILGAIQKEAKIKEIPSRGELIRDYSVDDLLDGDGKEDVKFSGLTKITGMKKEDLEKIKNYDSAWMGFHNGLTTGLCTPIQELEREAKRSGKNYLEPLVKYAHEKKITSSTIEYILEDMDINLSDKRYVEQMLKPTSVFLIRKNCLYKKDSNYPDLKLDPLLEFITLNGQLPLGLYSTSRKDTCACCGTFKAFMESGPVVTGFSKQQWRETIGGEEKPQPLCPLCYFSLLFYTYLTGTTKGQNVRPQNSMYLVLEGLNIKDKVKHYLDQGPFEEKLIERFSNFKKRFNVICDDRRIYVPQMPDLDIVLMSIIPKNVKFEDYPSMWMYEIYSLISEITTEIEDILGVSLNQFPKLEGPSIVHTQEGAVDLHQIKDKIEIYKFVSNKILYDPKSIIRHFRMFLKEPALPLSLLLKSGYMNNEELKEGLKMIQKNEKYEIAKKLWDIVALLNQLPKGFGRYEVVRPIKKFKGTPESLDLNMNFLLKDAKVEKKRTEEAMKIYRELRGEIGRLNDKEQKDLANYIKKTTYLFSRIEYLRGEDNE